MARDGCFLKKIPVAPRQFTRRTAMAENVEGGWDEQPEGFETISITQLQAVVQRIQDLQNEIDRKDTGGFSLNFTQFYLDSK
jgi:hypothetical protein